MTFRHRLTFFFTVIVVLPMITVAVVLFWLVSAIQQGRNDERLGAATAAAEMLPQIYADEGAQAAEGIARDPQVAAAIRAGDDARIRARLTAVLPRVGARAARFEPAGRGPIVAGSEDAVAPASAPLKDAGRSRGVLRVSVVSAAQYARSLERLTELPVELAGPEGPVRSDKLRGLEGDLGTKGTVELGDASYRYVGVAVPALDSRRLQGHLFLDESKSESEVRRLRVLVGSLVLAFLLLAVALGLALSRSLQAELSRLLAAVRKVRRGDFAVQVPAEGNDDFAELGRAFNVTASELDQRMKELKRERERLKEAIRRVGASFAKGLDRDAVIAIVVDTAVDGVGAASGRALVRRDGRGFERAGGADVAAGLETAMDAAEAAALRTRTLEVTTEGATVAAAHPLLAEGGGAMLGVLTVARDGEPFSEAERDLLVYLAGQAAVAIENVALHETVQRQAVTDELTGLFNHRKLQEVLTAEMERTRRFGHQLGLIMLDIDDFKQVNDRYGHMQGDLVLREVARVLRETSRGIDIPARYGGEELAVVLPEADLDGAYRFAERVRIEIERLDVPLLDRAGTVKVTASLGVATAPASAPTDKDALIAVADAALYRAKHEGKNRTVRAEPVAA